MKESLTRSQLLDKSISETTKHLERFAMAADIDAIKNSLKISLLLSLSNTGVTFSGQV